MLFKGVLIGLELREFDRMCAMRLVFPRKNQSSEVLTPDRGCVVLQKKIMEKTVMLVGTCTGICCFAQEQKEAEMFFNN